MTPRKTFSHKRIASSTLGDRLKRYRESVRLSVEDVSHLTKISPKYVRALEKSDYGALPSETYIRIFLKSYARVLRMNQEKVLGLYAQEARVYKKRFESERHKTLLKHRGV